MSAANAFNVSSDAPGKKLFLLGNEAIARGAIEAGVQVVAAYPGTPSTEIGETLLEHAAECGIQAQWSVNEKVAFGVAMGAALCGLRSMAVMKHVGVNLVMDPLITSAYIGTRGGLVLVEAEDPGQWSSQNEQDNRFVALQAYLPMLEPSSPAEALQMTRQAFELSEFYQHPFMLRSSTRLGHARSDIALGEIRKTRNPGVFVKDPGRYVMVPAVARQGRRRIIERLSQIENAVDSWPWNNLNLKENPRLGIITSGLSYCYTLEALKLMGLMDRVSVLKIGTPNPLPQKLIVSLLRASPRVLVIEELEPYLENEVRAIAQKAAVRIEILGKGVIPLMGELSTRKVCEALSQVLKVELPIDFAAIDRQVAEVQPLLPSRPPVLCPGCPHRASHYAMNMACRQIKQECGREPIRSGDIGCYALGGEAPLSAIDTSVFMGSGFDLANGMVQAVDAPVIAHMGDSTFFHSGIPPMLNAVQHKTRLVMVVLDNQTTAMTGAQPSPASGEKDLVQISPEKLARAAGIKFVRVVDPLDLNKAVLTLNKALHFEGPSLVVLRRPCNILEQREKRLRGEKVQPNKIDGTKCAAQSDPPCTAACPLHIDVRGYIRLIKEGKFDEALSLIRQKTPFPGILGRVCPQPCQESCCRAEIDDSMAIAALKRSAADYGRTVAEAVESIPANSKRVAIVGSGPSGLQAAYDLRKMGYAVTVFESRPVAGGMLEAGLPEFRLPADIVRSEIETVLRSGIDLKLNTRLGRDIQLKELLEQYQSVYLAVGAQRGRNLDVPGAESAGVISGIDFLRAVKMGQKIDVSGRVIVIGGGNVAIDCARSVLRLGGAEVNLLYRRSRIDMPAQAPEVEAAEKEGVKISCLSAARKVLTRQGRAVGLECIRTRPGRADASGRRSPQPLKGSQYSVDCDLVIAAIGESPDLDFLTQSGYNITVEGSLIKADPLTLQTSLPGLFAGGDVVSGPSSVVAALAAGRQAAVSIQRYLEAQSLPERPGNERGQICLTPQQREQTAFQKRVAIPQLPLEARSEWHEVETGYPREMAQSEAARCLACQCLICVKELGCPALVVENGQVSIDSSQCSGCGLCAQICPSQAIVKESSVK